VNGSNSNSEGHTAQVHDGSTISHLRRVARRQWWLWATAIFITLLLTLGVASFMLPMLHAQEDAFRLLDLRRAMEGLLGLVLLFDLYVIYQQLQIHRIQIQLSDQQELFRLISEHAADMIAVVDMEGKRLFNSPSYQRVLGYSARELGSTDSFAQIHNADRLFVKEAAEEARRTGTGRKLEYRFRHKDGTWRILESTASVIRNAKGEAEKLVIVNRDISERKLAEKTLRENQRHQAQKMEAVGRLSSGVAHDFNNLLGVIIGFSEILEAAIRPGNPLRNSVDQIRKAAERAAGLTRQLLAFSRQQVLEPKLLDLNGVVRDLEKMLRPSIGPNIDLICRLEPALGRVRAGQGQIEQVIINLAANGTDAMTDGGKLTIETTNVELDESFALHTLEVRPGPYVQLAVSDTGCGMDADTQARIFEPFFTTKELGKGTGLGLATVYGIVKQCHGYIWVDSELAKGTTFRIYLPRFDGALEAPSLTEPTSQSWEGGETILLVDDEESLRQIIHELLVQSGYAVLQASNGVEALQVAKQHQGPIHLLLTDVTMPGMAGPKLAEVFAVAHPETKVLFMSGYADFNENQSKISRPGTAILEKPFTRETLIRRVHDVIDLERVTS
jgi:two-component system, cell cycle sensor histidine kinase and response regulator CckA